MIGAFAPVLLLSTIGNGLILLILAKNSSVRNQLHSAMNRDREHEIDGRDA